MGPAPGWYTDPTDRHGKRWWDGNGWSDQVADDGTVSFDPLVPPVAPVLPAATSPAAPPAATSPRTPPPGQPTGAGGRPAPPPIVVVPMVESPERATAWFADTGTPPPSGVRGTSGAGAEPFTDRLPLQGRDRLPVDLAGALAAGAGALFAAGLSALGNSRWWIVLFSVIALAIGVGLAFLPDFRRLARPAAVAMTSVALVVLASAIVNDVGGDHAGALIGLLVFIGAAALWLTAPLRGRPFLLGLALVALMVAFGSEAASQSSASIGEVDGVGLSTGSLLDTFGLSGGALLVVGLIYLAVSVVLDNKGLRGVATCFVAAALIGSLFGTYLIVGTFNDTSGALFAALVGLALAVVGAWHQRRFTAWAGALIVAGGLAAAAVAIITPETSTTTGACVLVAGIVLGAVSFGLLWFEARRARGRDARPPASTLPPPPST
jgi:hypothetical protein